MELSSRGFTSPAIATRNFSISSRRSKLSRPEIMEKCRRQSVARLVAAGDPARPHNPVKYPPIATNIPPQRSFLSLVGAHAGTLASTSAGAIVRMEG